VVPPALYAEMSYAAAPESDEVVRLLGQILKVPLLQDFFNTLYNSFTARGQFLSPKLDFSGKLLLILRPLSLLYQAQNSLTAY